MAFDELIPDDASRRAFLRSAGAGLAGGSGLLLSACGGSSTAKKKLVAGSDPAAVRRTDISVLNDVLDLEHAAVFAYIAGVPLLSGHARAAAAQFLAHELAHVAKLESTIKGAGGEPNPPRPSYPLTNPRGAAQVLDILSMTESTLIDAYLGAIPKLKPGWLRAVAAGILANQGQHVSVLKLLQGRRPVPSAFVTASE
jgi:hypothetical protein